MQDWCRSGETICCCGANFGFSFPRASYYHHRQHAHKMKHNVITYRSTSAGCQVPGKGVLLRCTRSLQQSLQQSLPMLSKVVNYCCTGTINHLTTHTGEICRSHLAALTRHKLMGPNLLRNRSRCLGVTTSLVAALAGLPRSKAYRSTISAGVVSGSWDTDSMWCLRMWV